MASKKTTNEKEKNQGKGEGQADGEKEVVLEQFDPSIPENKQRHLRT